MGVSYGLTAYFSGQIEELDIANTSLSGTTAAAFKTYYNNRYGLSL